jgi:hypothetical protein
MTNAGLELRAAAVRARVFTSISRRAAIVHSHPAALPSPAKEPAARHKAT